MRLSISRIAITAATFLTGEISLTVSEHAEVSTERLIEGGNTKFLRNHEPTKTKLDVDDDEECLKSSKLDEMMKNQIFRTDKFDKWIKKSYTDTHIYNKLNIRGNPQYTRIFKEYQAYIGKLAKNLISP